MVEKKEVEVNGHYDIHVEDKQKHKRMENVTGSKGRCRRRDTYCIIPRDSTSNN